jgi:hypothetical protein
MNEAPGAPSGSDLGSLTQPRGVGELVARLRDEAARRGTTFPRLEGLVANVIVTQMMPPSVVKGGTGMRLRYGDAYTRETPDLDTSLRDDLAQFLAELDSLLATGWGSFTGEAVAGRRRAPKTVPPEYAMQPVTVRVFYQGRPFTTVTLEIGYDELEATTDEALELVQSPEVLAVFAALGLDEPRPVPVLPLHHQMAQKIHACTEPGSQRVQDLVDLQLMAADDVDPARLVDTCRRLFRFRQSHPWPPQLEYQADWESRYARVAEGLEVRDLPSALDWFNAYIDGLDRL